MLFRKKGKIKDVCPYCHQSHKHIPRTCADAVRRHHLQLCGVATSAHRPGCLLEAMQAYVERLRSQKGSRP